MPTKRLPNWPTKLALFIQEKRDQPFKWGENDCCLFGCDWVAMVTGEDPAETLGLRGQYTSALGAMRILKGLGGLEVLVSRCAEERGWTKSSAEYASRGSLGLFRTETGPALGVVNGATTAFVGPDGIVWVPTAQLFAIWHIPF